VSDEEPTQDPGADEQVEPRPTETAAIESGATDTGQTESGQTESGQTESGQTESGQTESGQTESGQTESGQTESAPVESGPTDAGRPRHERRARRRSLGRHDHLSALDRRRRLVAVGIVLVSLALAGVANSTVRRHRAQAAASPTGETASVVLSRHASSSAWYCPGPLPTGVSNTTAAIEVADLSSDARQGQLTLARSDGRVEQRAIRLTSGQVLRVPVPSGPARSYAAASVLVDGSGIAVSEVVHGPSGALASPCTNSVGPAGIVAGGSSALAANVELSLYDPGATPSVANVTISTPLGTVQPPALQGLALEPGQLVVENLGEFAPQQGTLSVSVATTGGRVVVGTLDSDVVQRERTLALFVGVRSPARRWYFAPSPSGGNAAQSFAVLNDSDEAEEVNLTTGGSGTATEREATISPGATVVLGVARDQSPSAMRWAELEAEDPVVVASRSTTIASPFALPVERVRRAGRLVAVAPAIRSLPARLPAGLGLSAATPVLARGWFIGGGECDSKVDEVVLLGNSNSTTARVHLHAVGAPPAIADALSRLGVISIAAHSATAVDLERLLSGAGELAIRASADEPITAGATLVARSPKGAVGVNVLGGVPIS
jgi:Family of unknown function (DUF5719)